jgi:hypothetical protein
MLISHAPECNYCVIESGLLSLGMDHEINVVPSLEKCETDLVPNYSF